jgi:hypothetical protein
MQYMQQYVQPQYVQPQFVQQQQLQPQHHLGVVQFVQLPAPSA